MGGESGEIDDGGRGFPSRTTVITNLNAGVGCHEEGGACVYQGGSDRILGGEQPRGTEKKGKWISNNKSMFLSLSPTY